MTTLTTNHLSLSRRARLRVWLSTRDPWSLVLPFGLALASLITALALANQLARAPRPAAAAQPTLAPIILIATAQALARPSPAPTEESKVAPIGHVLARAVVAYDAPAGRVLGAIDRGHQYQVVARFGADWLQADVTGSGVVWLASADLFDLPGGLADLAPTPAPQIVTVRVPVAAPAYQVDAQPPAPPAPAYQIEGATSGDAQAAQQWQSDAAADPNLAAHQAQQAASCDAGRITNADYCAAVRQWLEAQR